jgi:hypothetical protein
MRRLVTRVTRDRTIKRRDRLRGQFPGLILRAAPRGVQWPRSSGHVGDTLGTRFLLVRPNLALYLEAPTGIEPVYAALQAAA